MNAYEFTRFDADYTNKVKAQAYDVSVVALQIEYSNPDVDFRKSGEYAEAKEMFMECTMSCDVEEATGWMEYWMANAIAYGIQTKNPDWRYKFLAAYDLFNSLVHGEVVPEKSMWVSFYLADGTQSGATLYAEDYEDAKAQLMAEYGRDFGGIADYGYYNE